MLTASTPVKIAFAAVLIGLAWFYVRRAERNEDAFGDMVGREEPP